MTTTNGHARPTSQDIRTTLQLGDPVEGKHPGGYYGPGHLVGMKVWKNGKIRIQVLCDTESDSQKKPRWFAPQFWVYSWAWLERVGK